MLCDKNGTAVFIRLDGSLKRTDFFCHIHDFLFIKSDYRTKYRHGAGIVCSCQRLHGLRCYLADAFSGNQAMTVVGLCQPFCNPHHITTHDDSQFFMGTLIVNIKLNVCKVNNVQRDRPCILCNQLCQIHNLLFCAVAGIYENVGKRGGAYSSGISRPHPYVLLNHKNNLDCQFTLAHEMGHALHSYHSCKYQPISTSDYVIFVAEVASTCNEVLLMRHLLSKTTDKKQRAYLINHFLDQFKGTVYRQTMFAEFELAMGKMAENGEALTADALCRKYHELNKLYFGPDMISDDQIALEWARIPHFFYNYYVFQYATGFSAAVAIANRILKEGAPAVADYKKFLSGGCSTDPISLLKIAGVDMSSPEPVNSALALFGELVDELAELL